MIRGGVALFVAVLLGFVSFYVAAEYRDAQYSSFAAAVLAQNTATNDANSQCPSPSDQANYNKSKKYGEKYIDCGSGPKPQPSGSGNSAAAALAANQECKWKTNLYGKGCFTLTGSSFTIGHCVSA